MPSVTFNSLNVTQCHIDILSQNTSMVCYPCNTLNQVPGCNSMWLDTHLFLLLLHRPCHTHKVPVTVAWMEKVWQSQSWPHELLCHIAASSSKHHLWVKVENNGDSHRGGDKNVTSSKNGERGSRGQWRRMNVLQRKTKVWTFELYFLSASIYFLGDRKIVSKWLNSEFRGDVCLCLKSEVKCFLSALSFVIKIQLRWSLNNGLVFPDQHIDQPKEKALAIYNSAWLSLTKVRVSFNLVPRVSHLSTKKELGMRLSLHS